MGAWSVSREGQGESAVEGFKRASGQLRGDLLEQLRDGAPSVSNEAEQILKFHGIYAQDDRDLRRERSLAGEPLAHSFMARVVVPGGVLEPAQWLALDGLADEVANGSLRLTTRQAVQLHGVAKVGLQPMARRLAEVVLSSFGGCGDVVRNVVACPAELAADPDGELAKAVRRIAATFRPATRAHVEVFVEGELAASIEAEQEHAFYGATYLPRKFKIAVARPGDNCVDAYANDIGLVPVEHPVHGEGFTVLVGGGLGRSYAKPDTFARLADPLCFATYGEVDAVIAAVLTTYRDLGDRGERKRARLKYVVADLGLEAFRAEVEARHGGPLADPVAVLPFADGEDHLGLAELPDGKLQLGIRIAAGRVVDHEGLRLRSALREVARRFAVTFIATPAQDLLVTGIDRASLAELEALLVEHGVKGVGELGPVERNALACPALPTCPQALTEAERKLPEAVAILEGELASRGLADRRLQLRVTGCPNGCARPALAEVGLVGRTKSTYDLYVGGGPSGTRLAEVVAEKVKLEDVAERLGPILDRWRDEAEEGERLGDFYARVVAP